MKKILFLNLMNWPWHLACELEIMKDLIDAGNDVYSLSCSNSFSCTSSKMSVDFIVCHKCVQKLNIGLDLIHLPVSNRLTLQEVKYPKFPYFNDMQELKKYTIDGVNIGFGVANTLVMRLSDYNPSMRKYNVFVRECLKKAYSVKCNLERLISEYKFDEVYIFNGRFTEYYPAMILCKKYNIDYYLIERGCNKDKYIIVKNDILHRPQRYMEEAQEVWNKESDLDKKKADACEFFENSRKHISDVWYSYGNNQIVGKIPEHIDKSKENIVLFNSSMWEYCLMDEYKNPIADNENEVIKGIFDHYKDDATKHFYLRIHPHLKGDKSEQLRELLEFGSKYSNLTIIKPEDTIDTYAMIDNADKVVTFGSTVGPEATYWGRPSINAGVSIYEDAGCMYKAKTFDDLFSLIDQRELAPINKESTYLIGYWMKTFGFSFKYFKAKNFDTGDFLGVNLESQVKVPRFLRKFLKFKKNCVKIKHFIEGLKYVYK